MHKRILIIEDEAAIRDMLSYVLHTADMEVVEAADADAALVAISDSRPDLILLDWMLPGISGLDLARRLRHDKETAGIPIIMLTARGEEGDRVYGLDAGVDDYVVKPFSPRELVARIRAVLRRSQGGDDGGQLAAGSLRLDPQAHRIYVDDQEIRASPMEYRLLHFFLSHPDRVYTRGQLLDQLGGGDADVEERTVDVHIRRVRQLLEPHGLANLVQTVRGAGYRLSPP